MMGTPAIRRFPAPSHPIDGCHECGGLVQVEVRQFVPVGRMCHAYDCGQIDMEFMLYGDAYSRTIPNVSSA